MKTNLFKKIGAMVTAVAMLASLGTVAYADASISITSATVGAPDSNNVRLVTVTYSATNVTGDVAVLGYVGTGENDSATPVAYDDTKHTIVGIEQEAVDATTSTINFSVKYDEDSTEQSNVFNNENLIVTLGAQGVSQAAMTTIPLAYEAPATSWTASTAAFASTDAISADVAYNADEAAKKTAAETELDKLNVTFSDDNGNTATTTLGALKTAGKVTYTPAIEGNVFTYTIAFTAGDSGLTTGTGEDALSVIFGDNLSVIKVVNINVQAAPVELTGKVEISSTAKAEWDPTAELFTVTVPYGYKDTGVKTSPEVAMMAYISNGTATTPAFTTDEEKDFTNQTEMKIIGIMQHTDSETNGGEFVYKVSGEIGANTYMVVKVGAQGTTFGSDMIAIPLDKTTTSEPTVVTADHAVLDITGSITAADVAAVKTALEGKSVTVKNGSTEVGTVALTAAMIDTVKEYTGGTVNGADFNYQLTITAGTEVMSGSTVVGVIGEGGLTAYFNVEPPAVAWTVAKGTMDEAIEVTVAADATDAAILDAVEEAIVGKKITVTDANGTTGYSAKVTIVDGWRVAPGSETGTYTVEVPADATLDDVSPVGANVTMAAITVTFAVTVETQASTAFTITGFKAYDSAGAEVTKVEVAANTTEADAEEAIADKVVSIKAIGEGGVTETGWTASDWTIASYNPATAGDYTATATLVAPENALGTNTNDVSLTITVTVKSGEQYMLGDADLGESIGHNDWQVILNHLTGRRPNNDLKAENNTTTKTKVWMSADADANGSIAHNDWQVILNHLTGRRPNANIGQLFDESDYGK